MTEKIEIRGITKIFGKKPRGEALELLRAGYTKEEILQKTGHVVGLSDVTFDVQEGEVFVVMGLSGSGKSTLIRCLNRLIEPTTGEIFLDGENLMEASSGRMQELRRTQMSMVFQHFGLFPHRTVLDNVAYGLKVQNVSDEERLRRAGDALELVGLADRAHSMPDELSGGMQQRVGLARALATDPDILLMDEAFSALDPLIRRQMQNELLQLQERVHKTIVFITHDLNEALRVGSRVAIMQGGSVVQIGTPAQIVTEPETQYVADFIQDVDQGRVLNVGFVQTEPPVVKAGETVAETLRKVRGAEDDDVYVVGPDGRTIGLAVYRDLINADPQQAVDELANRDYPRTTADVAIADIYDLCAHGVLVAVEDEDGTLRGVVHPLHVLQRLGLVERIAETTDFDEAPKRRDGRRGRRGGASAPPATKRG